MKYSICLFSYLFFLSFDLFACKFNLPERINIATSLDEQTSFFYDMNESFLRDPYFMGTDCRKMAMGRKFLMIGLGPQFLEYDDTVLDYTFTDELRPSQCTIKNPPYKLLSFLDKVKKLEKKKNYLKNCFELHIHDQGRMPLRFPKNQSACSIVRLNKQKAIIKGGLCFINTNLTSEFKFLIKISKQCQSPDGLKSLNLLPMDIKGILNFYSAGDATGQSSNLTALDSVNLRVSTNPYENIIKSSNDFGFRTPTFAGNYIIPNIEAAQISVTNNNKNYFVKTPFFVDNRCGKSCKDGLCFSSCSYAQPVASEVSLYERKINSKYEYLTAWMEGGIARPDYQGILNGIGVDIPKQYMTPGRTYRLTYRFYDPKFDFERFKSRIRQRLTTIQHRLPELRHGQISDVPEIGEITDWRIMPDVSPIGGLYFSGGRLNQLSSTLSKLREYLGFKVWPPFYSVVCGSKLKNCKKYKKEYLTIHVDFQLKESSDGITYPVEIFETQRKSPYSKNFTKKKLPQFVCGPEYAL